MNAAAPPARTPSGAGTDTGTEAGADATTRAGLLRRRERLNALSDASLRAMTGRPGLHRRGSDLFEGGRPAPAPAMHMRVGTDSDFTSLRGISDASAAFLQYSREDLRLAFRPEDPMTAAVFDLLEHLRAESLVPAEMPGVRANIAARFDRWTEEFQGSDMAESALGMLVFAVAHVARSRILATPLDEDLADQFELTRLSMAGDIGNPLRRLRGLRHDQAAFAPVALELATIVAAMVHGAVEAAESAGADTRQLAGVFTFLGWEEEHGEDGSPPAPLRNRSRPLRRTWYRVYDDSWDRTSMAAGMFRPEVLHRLRGRLTQAQGAERIDPRRVARRLEQMLSVPAATRWSPDEEEGVVDGRRLARMVASPTSTRIFRAREDTPVVEGTVSLLLDCSGSMRHHRMPVACAADLLARACEAADIPCEVLGFTTRSWNGGAPYEAWRRAGSPAEPGRTAEREHIVLKPFDRSYRRSRIGLAALLRGDLYREGLDGEALTWACERAHQQEARRRIVVVISDGSPSESATTVANGENYLGSHLRCEVDRWSAAGGVEIAGLGLGLDLSMFYDRFQTVDVETDGTAGIVDGVLALCGARKERP